MLTHTFLHVPGIGYTTEQRLWQRGVHSWTDALALPGPPRSFSASRWELMQDIVEGSLRSLAAGDHRYFAQLLHARDQWRAFPEFRQRVGYLDIETDGMDFYHSVTVVGLYDGVRTHTYVAGDNLDQLAEDLHGYSLLVTFNGATFDLPFLRRRFGDIFDQLHIDLRYALARLGHHGGLKAIERRLGIARKDEIAGLMGEDAVRLWHEYQRGSSEALELLVEYNRADVENLETLMELAYGALWRHATEGSPAS
ncbi:ribonuclease H-like domain-containing protein [bacterium]|nr:ribonuclease H-like domain-containing protein [bacterium]